MKRKLTALGLILALALSPAARAAESFFPKIVDMPAFTDVAPGGTPGGAWYDYGSIRTAVEAGLMKGTGTAFEPGGVITLAQVGTLAARIHGKIAGYTIPAPTEGEPWYAPALAAIERLGLSLGGAPDAKATRLQIVGLLSAVLPERMTAPINTITTLPDTSDPDVLRFYNAGLVEGRDAYGTFDGGGELTRAQVAAIIARLVNPDLRQRRTPSYTPAALRAESEGAFFRALYRQPPLNTISTQSQEQLCALAGIAPETVMVTFDNLPAVTAREFLPLMATAIQSMEEDPALQGSSNLWDRTWLWNSISYDGPTYFKWTAVNLCTQAAILAENPTLTTTPCCAALEKFQTARHATLSPAANQLDSKAFYQAYKNSL